jgi:hypothetical protein
MGRRNALQEAIMRLKYVGLYLCYAALVFVVLLVIYGVVIGPMSVTAYGYIGLFVAIVGALIQAGVSLFGRLARLSKR